MPAAWPPGREVSFLLVQSDVASRRDLNQALERTVGSMQMARKRYYRRRGSPGSKIIRDTTKTASRLSWRKCLVLGAVGFTTFYWLVPGWIEHQIASQAQSPLFPVIEAILGRRLRFLRLAGIGVALICIFFAIRNYYTQQRMGRAGLEVSGFFARLLARILD
jgi:hypothetical protein